MGLRPWEFWRTTPAELHAMYRGYHRRLERDWDQVAWMVAYLIRPHVKRSVANRMTPKRLLGRDVGESRIYRRRHDQIPNQSED